VKDGRRTTTMRACKQIFIVVNVMLASALSPGPQLIQPQLVGRHRLL